MRLVEQERFDASASTWSVPSVIYSMRVWGCRVGRISLRIGDTPELLLYSGQIGYRVDPLHRGRGHAARAVELVLPLAREAGLLELWITCNPDNWPSIRTLEKVGAVYVETVELPPDNRHYLRGERQKRRYRLQL